MTVAAVIVLWVLAAGLQSNLLALLGVAVLLGGMWQANRVA
jgi:hypothetical protein